MITRLFRLVSVLLVCSASLHAAEPSPWPTPTAEMKPWTRWWWPASAVDKENLTRELTEFARAGLGGVEITPIYGAKGFEKRFVPFLSPQYVDMLAYTGAEAKRLGLKVDMATGTGWPFGGPQVTRADAELKVSAKDGGLDVKPTNFKVKRAAPGGAGLVVNPYSTAALADYLKPFDTALTNLPKGTINSQFHDSFEYTANWSPEFEARFKAMHGYDLRDHAAEFGGSGDPDTVARIKSDYRETLAALHLDYVRAWVDWSHKNGQLAREQAHGAPGNLLDLYAAADIPETEFFGSLDYPIPGFRSTPDELSYNKPQPLISRFASSAAHVTGKKLVSSETFTWLRQHFHEAPSEMKPELDQLFLAGINHVFYHGTCYSPSDAQWPGWLFYASTQYNDRNALWRDIGEGVNAYITRCQSLLQQGEPDTDVLVYWPVYDLWHNPEGLDMRFSMHDAKWITETPAGKLAQTLSNYGFGFDFISDSQIQTLKFEAGLLKTTGHSYKTIVIPQTQHIPLETFRKLLSLVKAGATLHFIGEIPNDVPGFNNVAQGREILSAMREALKFEPISGIDTPTGKRTKIGAGQLFVWGNNPVDVVVPLKWFGCSPNFSTIHGANAIRRITPDGHIYFITNLTASAFEDWIPIEKANSASLLDPLTGSYGFTQLTEIQGSHPRSRIYLQLSPGESIIVRTYKTTTTASAWTYYHPAKPSVSINSPWAVTFLRGGPELPPAYKTAELKSWTEQGGEAERFAGTARYETEFEVPAGVTADEWQLDLGDVRETARVFVNGQQVELLWSLPFRTKIGAFLKPGKNTLAIEVTNLSANRIRDLDKRGVVWKNFYEINFVNPHYETLDASTWPIMPSGLLGPVTLTPLKKFVPATEK